MRMERFWRWLGVALGKHWKFVAAVVVVITVLLGFGARNIDFATGQDSYLNPDSQIAIDNVAFQDDFGGETVILLFTSNDGSDVSQALRGRESRGARRGSPTNSTTSTARMPSSRR